MRCSFCDKVVLGGKPITVSGLGPAHEMCYQTNLINNRVFDGLNIAQLTDSDLSELADMVQMEKNARKSDKKAGVAEFEIELF